MKKKMGFMIAFTFMLLLILDPTTSFTGATTGLDLCVRVVIPSLFPFIFLSTLLLNRSQHIRLNFLSPICRSLGIPKGCESILMLGLIGGYPIGAASIGQAYRDRVISKSTGKRMLGFCNNAGPSFIFGILSNAFSVSYAPFILWMIQILSALSAGLILPHKTVEHIALSKKENISCSEALHKAIIAMTGICGWIILFRILCTYLNGWFLLSLPQWAHTMLIGLIELTNGCAELSMITSEKIRFIICSVLLSSGGICVAMQSSVVSENLGLGMYFPGKVIQILTSGILAFITSNIIFH